MKELKFYLCNNCKNLQDMNHIVGAHQMCCCEKMQLLTANTTDAATEKHVPVVSAEGGKVTVKVGSVEHPMTDAHYIQCIVLQTEKTVQRADLLPGEKPEAVFALADGDKVIKAYAYCNLHGLWATE
mgnify:FL=1